MTVVPERGDPLETPLYSCLKNLSHSQPLRLHMPGHKGKLDALCQDFLNLDFTELTPTGNLYQNQEPFARAQQLWAEKFGFAHSQLLTGGSTQGIYTALTLATEWGDKILLDRGAHRSAYVALGLWNLHPIYLQRKWSSKLQISEAISPDEVKTYLVKDPEIKAVLITSPTYYGLMSDVDGIAKVCQEFGCKLIVDGAHGAHFPWLGLDHYCSAHLVTISLHKTLPTLGQSALLLYRGFSPEQVAQQAMIFGTSSPSYTMLASMDFARSWMDSQGGQKLQDVAGWAENIRQDFPAIPGNPPFDPTRLTLLCPQGFQVAQELEKESIYLEMATQNHLLAILSPLDSQEDLDRFALALRPFFSRNSGKQGLDVSPPKELPKQKLSPHQVLHGKKITIPWGKACGEIAGENIAPYPPGIPVVAKGEEISSVHQAYLKKIGHTIEQVLVVATQ